MSNKELLKEFKDKKILVTGGTGSIGSVIIEELLKYQPRQIRVFSRDETKQFELSHRLGQGAPVTYLIGDIRDKDRLNLAMEGIDIVFHAAALKHVLACEQNPFEAVKTNVNGTQNVIDCAFANQVDKVVSISTDKATNPTNIMGCTKLLAEKLLLTTFFYKGKKKTKFCCVRFGNVLGARGSVIPLFASQIKKGKQVTVTDPDMTRFVMSIPQAVNLVLCAASLVQDREIFILKMPVATTGDIAQAMIELGQEKLKNKDKIDIKIVGKKDGERLHEKLLTIEESVLAMETKDMFIVLPDIKLAPHLPNYTPVKYPGASKAKVMEYNTQMQEKLSVKEIKHLLEEVKPFK